jgi:RNA polymerase sigma factor (sigma-70 family)
LNDELLAILDAHGAALHALLVRLTFRADVADDLLQDLFVKLQSSPSFRAARDRHAYVRRVAINLALDWRRAQRVRTVRPGIGARPGGAAMLPLDALIDAEEVGRILDSSAELSELARQAFVARYVMGDSFELIGASLGKTAHQARGLCHAAVRQIRERLSPNMPREAQVPYGRA